MKVGGIVMISALAIALPILVVVVAGKLMIEVSGRDRVVVNLGDVPKALQSRFFGYDATEAKAYWDALGPEGREAEIRLLQFDLLFPLLYGAALAFSITTLWSALDIRLSLAWFLIPAIVAVVADWIETPLLLRQLKNFDPTGTLDVSRIKAASIATITKSVALTLSALLIILLAVFLLVRGSRLESGQTSVAKSSSESVG